MKINKKQYFSIIYKKYIEKKLIEEQEKQVMLDLWNIAIKNKFVILYINNVKNR